MMIRVFFLTFFGLLAFSAAQSAQICTSMFINATFTVNNSTVLVYTTNLQTKELQGNPKTQLFLTNETFTSVDASLYYPYREGIRIGIGADYAKRCYSIGGYCSWLIGNNTASIELPVRLLNITDYPSLIGIVVDEDGISLAAGDLFTEDNSCREKNQYSFEGLKYILYIRQSCTAYKSVPPPPMNTPKCMAFNSSTTFYNSGQFFVNLNGTFDVIETGLNVTTKTKGTDQPIYGFSANNMDIYCRGGIGENSTCTVSLPKSDFKFIFSLTIVESFPNLFTYTTNFGKIIRRNDVYEMAEGVAFTKQSPCMWMGGAYSNSTVTVASQFCCTMFANN